MIVDIKSQDLRNKKTNKAKDIRSSFCWGLFVFWGSFSNHLILFNRLLGLSITMSSKCMSLFFTFRPGLSNIPKHLWSLFKTKNIKGKKRIHISFSQYKSLCLNIMDSHLLLLILRVPFREVVCYCYGNAQETTQYMSQKRQWNYFPEWGWQKLASDPWKLNYS